MGLLRSPVGLQMVCGILLLTVCTSANLRFKSSTRDSEESDSYRSRDSLRLRHHKKQLNDEIDLDSALNLEQLKDKQLPILPPIILLDFVNSTGNPLTNATDATEEKSKRTIDDELGYGYNSNSLFSGKHNYYFPAGETGTAVSIEESISPFEPKTVTEVVKPITEKPDAIDEENKRTQKPLFEALPDPLPLQNREPLPVYPPYPVFGQRTKLQKTSSADFKDYSGKLNSNIYSTPATVGSDSYNKLLATYTPTKPVGYRTGLSDFGNSPYVNRYARPMESSYIANYMTGKYGNRGGNSQKTSSDPIPNSSSSSINSQDINLADYPKYTVENGIRYEHKILWKYPDGKITETAPMSYVNSYSEYADQQKGNPTTVGGFRPSLPMPSRPTNSELQSSYNTYSAPVPDQSNIYSPKPIQFPNDQEQPNANQHKPLNPYVSSSSMAVSEFDSSSSYDLPSHQHQYGLKQTSKPDNHRPAISYNNRYSSYTNNRPTLKFPASGVKVEYTYNTENIQSQPLFTPSGKINQQVLSKYTPEAQNYLIKVFSGKKTHVNHYQSDTPGHYENSDFSNLLNYNPSISQYIKNPSSILKAQPTFVQAGNSLIPVIILRVDGTPPIPAKTESNINLKSLLRQYLTQYANSVTKATQNTNYDLGGTASGGEISVPQVNPIEDLKLLTETLESLRQRGHQDPDFFTGSYSHNKPHQQPYIKPPNSEIIRDHASYSDYIKNYPRISNEQIKKPQKVKSVQIIEDPRYTSYKINN